MAGRPKKNTVDYFPHYINHGKTMQILSTKHGNDGKSFWWTLLEILGGSENHYYDCNNKLNWEFLLSKTLLDGISVTEILNTLSSLDAIDVELWDNKVIWCQKFVDNIEDVYKKRGTEIPQRPVFPLQKLQQKDISAPEIPQSKAKDIKRKKITKKIEYSESFIKFYEAYPKKVDKIKAYESWKALDPNEELVKIIISAIPKQIEAGMLNVEEFKFCKNPATWLNNHIWEDPIIQCRKKQDTKYYREHEEPDKPTPAIDTEAIRQRLLKANPDLQKTFREKVIIPLKENGINEISWKAFIEPLVVVSVTDDTVTLYHEQAQWVQEHYSEKILAHMSKENLVIRGSDENSICTPEYK